MGLSFSGSEKIFPFLVVLHLVPAWQSLYRRFSSRINSARQRQFVAASRRYNNGCVHLF